MSLKKYIEERNSLRKWTKQPKIETPKTDDECKKLFVSLACDLSPENLCCDGEMPQAQVRAKSKILWKAWGDLENIMDREVLEGEVWDW